MTIMFVSLLTYLMVVVLIPWYTNGLYRYSLRSLCDRWCIMHLCKRVPCFILTRLLSW